MLPVSVVMILLRETNKRKGGLKSMSAIDGFIAFVGFWEARGCVWHAGWCARYLLSSMRWIIPHSSRRESARVQVESSITRSPSSHAQKKAYLNWPFLMDTPLLIYPPVHPSRALPFPWIWIIDHIPGTYQSMYLSPTTDTIHNRTGSVDSSFPFRPIVKRTSSHMNNSCT